MRADLAWPAGHRELYDALKAAGIDTDDLLSVTMFSDACRIINERLAAAGCEDLPRMGEDLRESVERVKRWAVSRRAPDALDFLQQMRAIYANEEDSGFDHESAHVKADALMEAKLIAFGYSDAIAFLREQTRWYA